MWFQEISIETENIKYGSKIINLKQQHRNITHQFYSSAMENFHVEILEFVDIGKLFIMNKSFFYACGERCICTNSLTVAVFFF